jgi:hypothetical protein
MGKGRFLGLTVWEVLQFSYDIDDMVLINYNGIHPYEDERGFLHYDKDFNIFGINNKTINFFGIPEVFKSILTGTQFDNTLITVDPQIQPLIDEIMNAEELEIRCWGNRSKDYFQQNVAGMFHINSEVSNLPLSILNQTEGCKHDLNNCTLSGLDLIYSFKVANSILNCHLYLPLKEKDSETWFYDDTCTLQITLSRAEMLPSEKL